ncbi:MAG: vitamin K epoxide reductase family protein [Nanoarchaeota archaeon]|nr:vitamin K epoxide reductase family protein [Nanoarchaeota archaeon]MBU1622491.1 vitamin K epoxide reductase family protein [Nanoarchaeota archaeon]MBU1973988.1 vitamin K epoxide reductase family protein [Nanoarchaeota archaeon]
MKVALKQNLLKVILVLSVLGLITSLYLIQNHYAPPTKGSLCDFGETVSCSFVNTSIYSVLFNVPVALFGALWFVILFLISWKTLKNKELVPGLLGWSALGILFIIYMIIAEIILRAICPFCTVVHVIVFIVFIISLFLFRAEKKVKFKKLLKIAKPWIIFIVIINLVPLVLFNLPSEKADYSEFAKCITANDVKMYGSFTCGVCAKERALFGESFQYIVEVECHPRGKNPQTKLCLQKDITKTPTWILEKEGVEIKREVGYLDIKDLAEFSGCNLEENKQN